MTQTTSKLWPFDWCMSVMYWYKTHNWVLWNPSRAVGGAPLSPLKKQANKDNTYWQPHSLGVNLDPCREKYRLWRKFWTYKYGCQTPTTVVPFPFNFQKLFHSCSASRQILIRWNGANGKLKWLKQLYGKKEGPAKSGYSKVKAKGIQWVGVLGISCTECQTPGFSTSSLHKFLVCFGLWTCSIGSGTTELQ